MASAAPPLDQLYKLSRDRLEVALDDEGLTGVDELTAWVDVCEHLHALDPTRNPRRLAASLYRIAQQLLLGADALPREDVAGLARATAAARRAHELLGLLGD